jgi:hypothetical protein
MLTFTPKGGFWSTANLIEKIRIFSDKVLRRYRDSAGGFESLSHYEIPVSVAVCAETILEIH